MLGFERDIKPLFRESDRAEMDFVLDLWSYDDVRMRANTILERITDGTMPCDAPWDELLVARFRRWTEEGCKP
jgi:hypothetical protein